MRSFTLACDDVLAKRIEGLAVEYEITEQEVLEQLVKTGLEEID